MGQTGSDLGVPGRAWFTPEFSNLFPGQENPDVDPIVLVIVLAVGLALAVIAALAISARFRGPAPRPE